LFAHHKGGANDSLIGRPPIIKYCKIISPRVQKMARPLKIFLKKSSFFWLQDKFDLKLFSFQGLALRPRRAKEVGGEAAPAAANKVPLANVNCNCQ
jgi:hypothetical protein